MKGSEIEQDTVFRLCSTPKNIFSDNELLLSWLGQPITQIIDSSRHTRLRFYKNTPA